MPSNAPAAFLCDVAVERRAAFCGAFFVSIRTVSDCPISDSQRVLTQWRAIFVRSYSALDPQYRTAVAAMIRAQADLGIQFITTTFRPELVRVAGCIQARRSLRSST